MYELSERSKIRLIDVHPLLVNVVNTAIKLTQIDFGITEGTRTLERQKKLVESGASQTLKSKHLIQKDGFSHAIDTMAYIDGRGSWEMPLYQQIADAFKIAAQKHGVKLTWGAAWHIEDISNYQGDMCDAMNEYIDLRRSQGRKPFIDGPHFQINID
jgi:peptidoglycan L-alanyl-D-glutamate endopeptidase CwlK